MQIFNSKLVLASPETASDGDYAAILGVIGHEVGPVRQLEKYSTFSIVYFRHFIELKLIFFSSCLIFSIFTIGLEIGMFSEKYHEDPL